MGAAADVFDKGIQKSEAPEESLEQLHVNVWRFTMEDDSLEQRNHIVN